jgi:hypothetical protein
MFTRTILMALASSALALLPMRAPDLPAQLLPVLGGSGGSAFARSCGAGRVLTGLRVRAGLSLDAIGLLCRPVNADGSLGSESTVGTLAGGGGGTADFDSCPAASVAVGARIFYGTYVDGVILFCHAWDKSTRRFGSSKVYEVKVGRTTMSTLRTTLCEQPTQPMVALRGREASLVDAVGFICDEP